MLSMCVIYGAFCLFLSGCGGEGSPSDDVIRSLLRGTHSDTEDLVYGPTPIITDINGKPVTCSSASKASNGPLHIIMLADHAVDIWAVFCRSPKSKEVRYHLWCKKVNGRWAVLSDEEKKAIGIGPVAIIYTQEK